MILRLHQGIIATVHEIGQKITHVLGAFSGKGTFSGISPEGTKGIGSLVTVASKGTFHSKGTIDTQGAINVIASYGRLAKGTFSEIRTIARHGSIETISTNER